MPFRFEGTEYDVDPSPQLLAIQAMCETTKQLLKVEENTLHAVRELKDSAYERLQTAMTAGADEESGQGLWQAWHDLYTQVDNHQIQVMRLTGELSTLRHKMRQAIASAHEHEISFRDERRRVLYGDPYGF